MARMPVYNLEWQDPPAAEDMVIQGILAQLQNHPGKWARIITNRSQTQLAQKWLGLGCEAKAVRLNPGGKPATYDIYARWPIGKAATVPNAIREEVAKSMAPPPTTPVRQAVAAGHALVPAPSGGYLAQRAARGVGDDGKPVRSLHQ
jgi:hypothetical protein